MKAFGSFFGPSFLFWFLMGIIRIISEKLAKSKKKRTQNIYKHSDIAAIVPAHNEELVIKSCIDFLKKSLDPSQIYVTSDGSQDKTYEIAKAQGVIATELDPGRGKAKAIVHSLETHQLFERYKLIFIVDADTKIDKSFLEKALPVLNDRRMAVVFGKAAIYWPQHIIPNLKYYYIAYRERLNRILQYFLIYGMTWRFTNVNFVVPGFCALYRSDILKKLEIDSPGLLIEDFNLAFQLHKKKLGTIGYSPSSIGWDQHPDNLKDYWNQVRRWNIGFFQTVKMNGFWFSFFYIALLVFSVEVFLSAIYVLLLPLLVGYLVLTNIAVGSTNTLIQGYIGFYQSFGPYKHVSLSDIFMWLFMFDYGTSVVIGLTHKKHQFIFYGLFFFVMHYVTSLILISSLIPGFFGKSLGRWSSPARRDESVRI